MCWRVWPGTFSPHSVSSTYLSSSWEANCGLLMFDRRSQADEIYRLAIARRAKPLERLKQRYKAFQVRMMTSTSLPTTLPPSTSIAAPSTSRTTLGSLAGTGALPSTVRPANGKKNALTIFVEGKDEDESAEFQGDLQTRGVARKENERDAVGWKGETLPQGKALAPRTPKLEVFRDDVSFLALFESRFDLQS